MPGPGPKRIIGADDCRIGLAQTNFNGKLARPVSSQKDAPDQPFGFSTRRAAIQIDQQRQPRISPQAVLRTIAKGAARRSYAILGTVLRRHGSERPRPTAGQSGGPKALR